MPQWAKGIVWYQIVPERFRNGDRANDPTRESLQGAWPFDHASPWELSPWTAQWYRRQSWEQAGDRSLWSLLQRRRYGGDLQGILDRLDYLEDLGVGGLYLTPVFASPSAHKYDGESYHHIDPHFGPDPIGDRQLMAEESPQDPRTWRWTRADSLMRELIQEVHRRGMRILFDGVFNHVGWTHWAFRDLRARQQQSPFGDWFRVLSWDDPKRGTKFAWQGWFGHENLPEWRQDDEGIVAAPREHLFAAIRRWMDPDGDGDPRDGIDGWRLDVAFCIAHPFWKAFRRHVRAIHPEAYLVAEVIRPPEVQQPYLRGDEFDAVMNYNFAFACHEFLISEKHSIAPKELDRRLRELRDAYPRQIADVMQNLLGSHDSARLATQIVNRRSRVEYRNWLASHRQTQVEHNRWYNTRKPHAAERRLQQLAAVFQMTYVGAPMIYYGDEAGMWGANDPCCRKPMVWPDLEYEAETILPDGRPKEAADSVSFDRELFDWYRRLVRIRNASPALRLGDYRTLLADDQCGVFAFVRRHEGERVLVVFNRSRARQTIALPAEGICEDLLVEIPPLVPREGRLELEVPPRSARILRSCPRLLSGVGPPGRAR